MTPERQRQNERREALRAAQAYLEAGDEVSSWFCLFLWVQL